jgi:DNA-binding transcriptional regulator YdaS (Cro superfamily)
VLGGADDDRRPPADAGDGAYFAHMAADLVEGPARGATSGATTIARASPPPAVEAQDLLWEHDARSACMDDEMIDALLADASAAAIARLL